MRLPPTGSGARRRACRSAWRRWRFSIDFRTAHIDDVVAKRGAQRPP
jgi:hypothetical protein